MISGCPHIPSSMPSNCRTSRVRCDPATAHTSRVRCHPATTHIPSSMPSNCPHIPSSMPSKPSTFPIEEELDLTFVTKIRIYREIQTRCEVGPLSHHPIWKYGVKMEYISLEELPEQSPQSQILGRVAGAEPAKPNFRKSCRSRARKAKF